MLTQRLIGGPVRTADRRGRRESRWCGRRAGPRCVRPRAAGTPAGVRGLWKRGARRTPPLRAPGLGPFPLHGNVQVSNTWNFSGGWSRNESWDWWHGGCICGRLVWAHYHCMKNGIRVLCRHGRRIPCVCTKVPGLGPCPPDKMQKPERAKGCWHEGHLCDATDITDGGQLPGSTA